MKAIVYEKVNSSKILVLRDIVKPMPNTHEVLVRIHAASVNALDYRPMQMGVGIPKSRIFGADIVGMVEAVGRDTTTFKIGDMVVGDISENGCGGFAEYVAVDERVLALKPSAISDEFAAAVPVAAVTALQALRDKGELTAGMRLLIYGAGGGVGTYAVQLASYFGAQVTAVCSTRNTALVRSLGASEVIDYTREDITTSSRRFDRIIAINGYHRLSAYKHLLVPNGTVVMVGGSLKQIFTSLLFGSLMSIGSKKMRTLAAKPNRKDLEFVLDLVASGKIHPVIDRCYPLEQTAEAMSYVSEGHAKGKVVITVTSK
ncbi:NAD(P)-dependent alcohol dehydrogenase [uncultured Sphaerochaeta sp.]|uniref:NAD(P)-dependent alcohol dehydrogenase n=1 Tax=uncultured Sphaerochaeta sp. TaxID=886478 RepID=UPI0029CA6618|nr:NAD(P)-dependent alcohol dehydrogenase [uncultured Sphaerochaeta sp.]